MRSASTSAFAAALLLTLAAPSALGAATVLRPLAAETADGADAGAAEAGVIRAPVDQPASLLIVPLYEVNRTNASGTTTLYAVRNVSASPVDLTVQYLSPGAALLREDLVTLGARQTLSRNIRDVAGLPVDPDGFARGIVRIRMDTMPADVLVGDFLQVDVGDDFATGDRMISAADFCDLAEVRFFDVGSGTDLTVLVNIARGSDPMTDPPSFVVRPIGEDGALFPTIAVFTDDVLNRFTEADFTTLGFGTLRFDFSTGGGGSVHAKYSAEGRFSVGMNGACVTP